MEEKKPIPEYQKRASKKYLAKFVEMKIRITPEEHAIIKAHAEKMDESATGFIKRAVAEARERDNQSFD